MRITLIAMLLVFMSASLDAEARKKRYVKKSKPSYTQTQKAPSQQNTKTETPEVQGSSTADMVKGAVVGAVAGAATGAAVNHFMGDESSADAKPLETEENAAVNTVEDNSKVEDIVTEEQMPTEQNNFSMMLVLALAGAIIGFMFFKLRK